MACPVTPRHLDTQVILFHQCILAELLRRAAFELDLAVHDDVATLSSSVPWCKFGAILLRMRRHQCPQGGTVMATIVKRIGKHGQLSYRAPVRREGGAPL